MTMTNQTTSGFETLHQLDVAELDKVLGGAGCCQPGAACCPGGAAAGGANPLLNPLLNPQLLRRAQVGRRR